VSRSSLRTQLIVSSTVFVTVIWLFATIVVAFNLRWFLSQLVDLELQRDMQLSKHLYEIISPAAPESRDQLEELFEDVQMMTSLEGEWGFKVFSLGSNYITGSRHVPDFPAPTQEGFFDLILDGELWRAYAKKVDDSIWTVLLANKSGANMIILQNLNPTPWFLLLIIPLTIIAAVYGINRATRPIVNIERSVRQRSPRSLEPLAYGDIPVEVEPLVNAVNQLLGRVKNLVDHEHRFVANAAHELQTPLAAMKTELQNCLALDPPEDIASTLQRLEQRVNRSVYSVKQLLTLARLDPDAPLQKNDSVNVEHLVYDELAALGDDILRFDLNCRVECSKVVIENCNAELLKILVRNLLENAIKYATGHSEIEIVSNAHNGRVSLRVANDCAPLSPQQMAQLRDSFFRVPGNDATGVGETSAATRHGGPVSCAKRGQWRGSIIQPSSASTMCWSVTTARVWSWSTSVGRISPS